MRILTAEQMQAADRHAIGEIGMPALVLMENAGAEVVSALEDAFGDPEDLSVLVLCGSGNNGGDGMVVARRLHARGGDVRVLLLGDPARLSADAAHQWALLERLGVLAEPCAAEDWAEVAAHLASADVIVDALLGTGFRGQVEGLLSTVIEDVNACPVPVVAVDVPSGLSGSSPEVGGAVIEAALTVTFGAPKLCHVFAPASSACGDVVVADIGIPDASLAASGSELELADDDAMAPLLAALADRAEDAHKGDFGHVLVVGGSATHPGAVALAGRGALAGGAGLVTVASPCAPQVGAHAAELMHAPLPATADGHVADEAIDVAALLARKTAVVVGPGLGTGAGAARLVGALLDAARVPVLLDADALNLVALHGLPAPVASRPLVLTPHPGELARLARAAGVPDGDNQVARMPAARELARRVGGIVVVKGFRTLVVGESGAVLVSSTGGPGLATGGTGDVLAGLLGALLAQGMTPRAAATVATFLHGRAGDLAEDEIGVIPLVASDVLRLLPRAIASVLDPPDGSVDA